MDDENITPISVRQTPEARTASRQFQSIIDLLDQLEDARDAQRSPQIQPSDRDDWAPRDREGIPMRLSISDGDNFVPIMQSEADWDRATVEREDIFERRFGFAWPREYRKQLIELKHERKLTDREIRWLYRAGSLRRRESQVRFAASGLGAIIGCTMIGLLLLPMTLIVLRTFISPPLSSLQVLELALLAAVVLVVQRGAYRVFVEPWRIRRRCADS